MDLKSYKKLVDKKLKNLLDRKIAKTNELIENHTLANIQNYIYKFMEGGKRVRPYLIYLAYSSSGGKNDDIIDFSLGFELFHYFALIHDDIMDNGIKRHGIDTFHIYTAKQINHTNAEHLAISQSILMGDLLFNWANETINGDYDFDQDSLNKARKNYTDMINDTIIGQMIDIDITGTKDVDKQTILIKNFLKTASYTFIRPLQTGAILANIDSTIINQFKKLGENLGQAYQIRDDLNDLILENGDKTPFSDIQEGQQTIFTDYIFSNGNVGNQKILKECIGKELNKNQILRLRQIFNETGAVNYGKDLIAKHLDTALEILDSISFCDNDFRKYYLDIIKLLSN